MQAILLLPLLVPTIAVGYGMATHPFFGSNGKHPITVYYTVDEKGVVHQDYCRGAIISPNNCARDEEGNVDPRLRKSMPLTALITELQSRIEKVFEDDGKLLRSEKRYKEALRELNELKKVSAETELEKKIKAERVELFEDVLSKNGTRDTVFDWIMESVKLHPRLVREVDHGNSSTGAVDELFRLVPNLDSRISHCEVEPEKRKKLRLLSLSTHEYAYSEVKPWCGWMGTAPLDYYQILDALPQAQKSQKPEQTTKLTCKTFAQSPIGKNTPVITSGQFAGKKVTWSFPTTPDWDEFAQEGKWYGEAIVFDSDGDDCILHPLGEGWKLPVVCTSPWHWQSRSDKKEVYCGKGFVSYE